MRANPVVRAITVAAALSLAASSVATAQEVDDTRFPGEVSETLVTAVITSALDDADTNARIVRAARDYHDKLGGKTSAPELPKRNSKKEPPERGGWLAPDAVADRDAATQEVVNIVNEYTPDLILISGGDWRADLAFARSKPATTIVDFNQPAPCLTDTGQPDASGECIGDVSAVPANYKVMEFAVEQGAYLAGVVAARESRGQPLGIISGSADCLECDRYVTGFINGARSVEPGIEIRLAYVADDEVAGFSDEASARTYTEAFLDVYQPSVLLPVGRAATMGMVEAACEAGVKVIGAGIDISALQPELENNFCVMASVVPDVSRAVDEAMFLFSTESNPPVTTFDLEGGGVTVTDEWKVLPTKRVDTNDFYAEAELALLTGQVEACPDGCGAVIREPVAEDAAAG